MIGWLAGRGSRPPDAGQGIVEFGLILVLAVAIAVVVIIFFSPQLAWVLRLIGTEIDRSR